jgi:CheY-like chemotaxis protein
VVKRLVEMHGGRVSARSRGVGKGSTFEIRLPLADRAVEPAQPAPAASAAAKRVLVVDDNEDAATTLAMILSIDGHEVQTVFSARDALASVREFVPDVVLLDIGLPELDGYEVARRIRSDPSVGSVKLVALTGYGQAEDKQRARAAGFDDHLVKPVEMRALYDTLAVPARR